MDRFEYIEQQLQNINKMLFNKKIVDNGDKIDLNKTVEYEITYNTLNRRDQWRDKLINIICNYQLDIDDIIIKLNLQWYNWATFYSIDNDYSVIIRII